MATLKTGTVEPARKRLTTTLQAPVSKTITAAQIRDIAERHAIPYACLRAVIEVEGAGEGFDPATGKLLIQFEPLWFKRRYSEWKKAQTLWISNKVGVQSVEWKAFNDAYRHDATAAMEATSIGMMQVMGFHWQLLGFESVGKMWDYAKVSEANQVELGVKFIRTNPKMYRALQNQDWATFAYYYNGSGYAMFKYDTRLAAAYKKFK